MELLNVKRPGRLYAEPGRESGSLGRQAGSNRTTDRSTHRRFVVEIDAFGRRREWGRFRTAADADAEITKLRRIGFVARRVLA
jgi:hypothetical protein